MSATQLEQVHERLILLGADLWVFAGKCPPWPGMNEAFRALITEVVMLTKLVEGLAAAERE